MPVIEIPQHLPERVACSIAAAVKYEIPANLMLAVAEQEGGSPGLVKRNGDGTVDVGSMQFNTKYLADLRRYGISAEDVSQAGCYPFDLAAWRLRGHILRDAGDLWTRAANYHSRTPSKNATYRAYILPRAARWQKWLEARFVTYDSTAGVVEMRVPTQGRAEHAGTSESPALPSTVPLGVTSNAFRVDPANTPAAKALATVYGRNLNAPSDSPGTDFSR
ncbi:hypothetical protein [Pandoraea apista]|uniref:hypothetical protein n=1 Tax=Pandoraea apista TaxID=93218 RepID=UPI00065866A1|nr:hypothetical protein [Pandoraea apista]ALS68414.1 hypothetical protein AT395_25055 [Pandoraea apista]CFB60438.1 Transglycosylase SLT domain protein [Pandoraea apista]